MFRRVFWLFTGSLFAFAANVQAEKINMSPESLQKTATHVIVGKVVAVYERTETIGDWKYTRCVAEVSVDDWEKTPSQKVAQLTKAESKGARPQEAGLVYVRYWHRRWGGSGRVPPSTSGHRGLPALGETLRIYLARNAYDGFSRNNMDGGLNVIGANGFEKLAKDPGK